MKTYHIFFLCLFLSCSAFAQGKLKIDKSTFDYGVVEEWANEPAEFSIRNVGKGPLNILPIHNGYNEDYKIIYPTAPIMPGGTGTLRVLYYTTEKGNFNIKIPFYSSDSPNPQSVTLKGKIKNFSPSALTECPPMGGEKITLPPIVLQGFVFDADTKMPLDKIKIQIKTMDGKNLVKTDKNGKFTEPLRAGPYAVLLEIEGYEPKEMSFMLGRNNNKIDIPMTPIAFAMNESVIETPIETENLATENPRNSKETPKKEKEPKEEKPEKPDKIDKALEELFQSEDDIALRDEPIEEDLVEETRPTIEEIKKPKSEDDPSRKEAALDDLLDEFLNTNTDKDLVEAPKETKEPAKSDLASKRPSKKNNDPKETEPEKLVAADNKKDDGLDDAISAFMDNDIALKELVKEVEPENIPSASKTDKKDPTLDNSNNKQSTAANESPEESLTIESTELNKQSIKEAPSPTTVAAKEETKVKSPPIPETKELSIVDYNANNIVFLIDVSLSMRDDDKLELVKKSMGQLLDILRDVDKVALITYSSKPEVKMNSLAANQKEDIISIINQMEPGGLTRGVKGIEKAYEILAENYIRGGNNQIILATDGLFSNYQDEQRKEINRFVGNQTKHGTKLSVIGFGDDKAGLKNMKKLASQGAGAFLQIESSFEASNILIEEIKANSKK